jgi:hypothetical protein
MRSASRPLLAILNAEQREAVTDEPVAETASPAAPS